MEKGVLKYGEYDGEQSEPIRVDRDRESQTRVKKHAEKAEKIRVSTLPATLRAFSIYWMVKATAESRRNSGML